MTAIATEDAMVVGTVKFPQPARQSYRCAGMRRQPAAAIARPRRKLRSAAVVVFVLTGFVIYGALRAFADVKAATSTSAPAYFVVMPHPATDENRRVADWLSRRLNCPIVGDASVHEVGVRGGAK